jgi:putative transposase
MGCRMTAPRRIVPGDTYLITRRCTRREYLLRPDNTTNEIFGYCLAEAAHRFGIGLLAWKAMSNHYHAVVHDPKGRLPAFLEQFHKMLAKALNARWGRWENLWSTEETCVTRLVMAQDVFDKVLYVLCNPIAGARPSSTSMASRGRIDGRASSSARTARCRRA